MLMLACFSTAELHLLQKNLDVFNHTTKEKQRGNSFTPHQDLTVALPGTDFLLFSYSMGVAAHGCP